MNILPRSELKALMETEDKLCISIYLSIPPSGEPSRQLHIKLKNALKESEELLKKTDLNKSEIESFLKPLQEMITEASFRENITSAVVIFISDSGLRNFWLPIEVKDVVRVSSRFNIKPVLALFSGEEQFYLLTLSQKKVRFFKGSRYALAPLEVDGIPESMKEALNYESREKTVQRVAGGASGGRSGYSHGHGAGYDLEDEDIQKYFRMIDRAVSSYLKESTSPLLLAAVDEEISTYKRINSYSNILEKALTGNPDTLSSHELHSKAMEIMDPVFKREQNKACQQYLDLAGTEKTTSDIEKIINASLNGRVQTCFVASGEEKWGFLDTSRGLLDIHDFRQEGDQDLLDLAAYQTILNGGKVYAVSGDDVPGEGIVSAILRY